LTSLHREGTPRRAEGDIAQAQGPHRAAPPDPEAVRVVRSRPAGERRTATEKGEEGLVGQGAGLAEGAGALAEVTDEGRREERTSTCLESRRAVNCKTPCYVRRGRDALSSPTRGIASSHINARPGRSTAVHYIPPIGRAGRGPRRSYELCELVMTEGIGEGRTRTRSGRSGRRCFNNRRSATRRLGPGCRACRFCS
jgi:hypothetical protein